MAKAEELKMVNHESSPLKEKTLRSYDMASPTRPPDTYGQFKPIENSIYDIKLRKGNGTEKKELHLVDQILFLLLQLIFDLFVSLLLKWVDRKPVCVLFTSETRHILG